MSVVKKKSLKDFLIGKLSDEEIEKVNRAFELVGDIVILDVPEELDGKAKIIGDAMLEFNPNVKTVLKKSGIHKGEFRTQDLIYVSGEDKKETIYKENGIRLKINPETVYFSPRLSTERGELMEDLGEKRILVMFSGAGPYSFVALKNQPNIKRITSIEINPEGHRYALENMMLNKNIIKKSKLFNNLVDFLKRNNISVYEKFIAELLNDLRLAFFNGDVTKIIPNLNLKKYEDIVNQRDGYIFDGNIENVYNSLKVSEKKILFLDFDKISKKDNMLFYYVLFSRKFDFVVKIDGVDYVFDDEYRKGLLLNLLEGNYRRDNVNLYDEVFMPLPKDASDFLEFAFAASDSGAIVHMYDFVHENEFPHLSEKKVLDAAKKLGRGVEILQTRKVGQYSPRKYRVCCDFRVL